MEEQVDPEMLRRMEKAMRRLARLDREVFLAHRLDDMPYREIASRTGLSMTGVERCIARAICELDRSLHQERRPWWRRWF